MLNDESTHNDAVIEVDGLTKNYGGRTAIADLSFSVPRGHIVGFLGPNGAGKSTTMRILAGFLAATSGTVRVAGIDVADSSLEVRRRVGFMPENNPLHLDMRVKEYVRFRGKLKGITGRRLKERMDTVLGQFELERVSNRIIGQLSKGYRQRVGLADAILHEPEVLILDEPTIGLDPHQTRTVRQLIKSLGKDRTVVISSHILPEVEVTCTQLFIFHEGQILASGTLPELSKECPGDISVVTEIAAGMEELRSVCEHLAEVREYHLAQVDGAFIRCSLTPRSGEDLRPKLSALAAERHWPMRELTQQRHTLEDIFVHLVNRRKEGDA